MLTGCLRCAGAGSVHDPVPVLTQYASPDLIPDFVSGRRTVASDPAWADSGAASPAEYAFWAGRSCGPTCLQMLLGHLGRDVPSLHTIVADCCSVGAFVVDGDQVGGLYYQPFVEYLRTRYGLDATVRADLPLAELTDRLAAGELAIVSVHKRIRYAATAPVDRGGHLVLAYGYADESICFNNPSGHIATARRATMHRSRFDRFYAGRGITIDLRSGA